MSIPFSDFPEMFRIRQKFKDPKIDHLTDEVKTQLSRLNLKTKVRPGQTVAITAGSRGITGINHILKAIVDHFKKLKSYKQQCYHPKNSSQYQPADLPENNSLGTNGKE